MLSIFYVQSYRLPDGKEVNISAGNKKLIEGTKYYGVNAFKSAPVPPTDWQTVLPTEFKERSTIAAARDWGSREAYVGRVGALNFASAKRRGGGFKNGAQAQEESLARASNLYLSLSQDKVDKFYEAHQRDDSDGYYSDAMIYSKGVTVFRDEFEQWASPVEVDMLTSAAVNAGVVRRRMIGRAFRRDEVEQAIEEKMLERMSKILQLFAEQKVKVLVLGSFGTGSSLSLISKSV